MINGENDKIAIIICANKGTFVGIKQSLAERYTPDFIAQAEERRSRLDYKSLHVGSGSHVRIERVKALLYQTHQNYYFGNFSASCILCGILFEQSLICLLEEEIVLKEKITYKQGVFDISAS